VHYAIHVHRDDFRRRGGCLRAERKQNPESRCASQPSPSIRYPDIVVRITIWYSVVMTLIERFNVLVAIDWVK
jgi:hypothetical protein